MPEARTRLLAVCAVAAEAEALVALLPGASRQDRGPLHGWYAETPAGTLDVVVAGVGPAAAGAATGIALALAKTPYAAVLCAGIAGAFAGGGAVVGGVVVADELIAADLGVLAPEGFLDVETLGFGTALGRSTPPAAIVRQLGRLCSDAGLATVIGPVLTLSSFTGTDERAHALANLYRPAAEAMEGTGIATAAAYFGVPVVEIRTISNSVGNRDREAWDLPAALTALQRVGLAVTGASWEL